MLSLEADVEAHALRQQGWSISAIARHLGIDRKTVRRYLNGEREPGRRKRTTADPFEPFVEYCRIRLADDPHLAVRAIACRPDIEPFSSWSGCVGRQGVLLIVG